MPNTCRTDTFMSGKPAGAPADSCALVMAAVVISPPRSRALPKPDLRWLRMGAGINLSESNGRQKPAAQSKFRCIIIKIGAGLGFWKAALRITLGFTMPIRLTGHHRYPGRHFPPLPGFMLGLRLTRNTPATGIL